MNIRDNSINDNSFKKLLQNDNYYRNIFKKTEKIVSVVFYILHNIDIDKKSETLTSNIASKAHFAHENALRTLEVKLASSKEVLEQFAQSLVGLESSLRVAGASEVITQDVLFVLTNEIDGVLRGLRAYLQTNTEQDSKGGVPSAFMNFRDEAPLSVRSESKKRTTSNAPQAHTDAPPAPQSSAQDDRRERIKTILEAKGEATIKDISSIITDVSEKTIQRELNAMIDESIVKRQGERRWSKYSVM